ncbi:MAG: tyrosine-type recombinase/integrase, partial [Methyloceanibacter sp.]
NSLGAPKSAKSQRTVPFGSFVSNTLKEWKLACPPGELVFPNSKGNLDRLANIIQRGLIPAVTAAGLTINGKAKYSGMHLFRHFYASWCIDRGLPPKVIQERLGHSSITMTFDRYGHLFPRVDDSQEARAGRVGSHECDTNATCWLKSQLNQYFEASFKSATPHLISSRICATGCCTVPATVSRGGTHRRGTAI